MLSDIMTNKLNRTGWVSWALDSNNKRLITGNKAYLTVVVVPYPA